MHNMLADKGLYGGAVMQSSATNLCVGSLSRSARDFAFNIGRRLSIFTNNSHALVNALREIHYISLQRASVPPSDQLLEFSFLKDLVLSPLEETEHPGAVFSSKSCERLKNGEFNRTPLLLGFTSEEGNAFAEVINLMRPLLVIYDLAPNRLVPTNMNITNQSTAISVGQSIHSHYVGAFGAMVLSETGYIHYSSDNQFVRPIRKYVQLVMHYVNTYYYRLSYEGDVANPDRGNLQGVAHGEYMYYIFRSARTDNAGLSDVLTRKRMVRLLTNFAKTRNPTPTSDSLLEGLAWPVASTSENLTYLDIGSNLQIHSNPHQSDMEFWDAIYNEFGNPPYDTYEVTSNNK